MTDTYFVEYTRLEVQHFRDTLLQNLGNVKKSVAERTRHQRQYERRVNKRQMQTQESKIDTGKALDADLVDTESIRTDSTVQDDSSRSGNDTDADDADIRPIYDEEPMAEVQLTAECNIFAIGQQHIEQPEIIVEGRVDQNSSKNMPRFSSNDMVHNHYLDVAKKKIQERDRNSTTSVPTSARIQTTTDDRKPNPRSNNQTSRSLPVSKSSRVTITVVPKADHSKSSSSFSDSKNFVCSTCHRCVFNANHDACITKLLKEVNSRAKIQSNKTTNSNKPVDQKSHTQKPSRQIFTGHRFSPNKTSAVSEKTSPRSDLRWKPTGRIFKSVGLRWIPTGKLFVSCTSKVDSEPPHGSNVDIPHIHECKQTLDVSAGTSINVQKEQSLDLSAEVHQAVETVTTSNELDVLFGPLFDKYFKGENQVVLKSSAVTTTDASNKRQQQPDSTSSTSTQATTVTANGNFDL
ncbi:hypothetical protein Tco_0937798 [Tanacetum coccineum]|uniref:Uncharacterized protein n=1 Tax=Tanacetum coccineum TaxID=301880 RepID=A0ABQ5DI13_9ASTR